MNSPYSDRYGLQYYATATDLEYSPLMQTVPTSTTTTTSVTKATATSTTSTSALPDQSDAQDMNQQMMQPLYRPYNHYPTYGITPTISSLGPNAERPYKSAFHPVLRSSNTSTVPTTTTNIYPPESGYYNPLSVTASEMYYIPATSENPYSSISTDSIFGRTLPPKISPYNNSDGSENTNKFSTSDVRRNIQNNDTCTYHLPPKQKPCTSEKVFDENSRKPVIESAKLNNELPCVYNWDTLLPTLLPTGKRPDLSNSYDPKIRRESTISPTKMNKRQRRNTAPSQSNAADVTVIDLTVNEEDEDDDKIITKPIEINGNEILITTNTKTMQAITFRKPNETTPQVTPQVTPPAISPDTRSIPESTQPKINQNQPNCVPNQSNSLSNQTNDKRTCCANFPVLFANLTKATGYRNRKYVPPREQSKFITKYNGWMRQYRTYNGFRYYVRQNYARAQAYATQKQNSDKTFVQDTLMNWWNELSDPDKDYYIKNANFMLTKRSDIMQNSANKTVDSLNVPASFAMPNEASSSNSVVVTSNMTESNFVSSENTNKVQSDAKLHSPKP